MKKQFLAGLALGIAGFATMAACMPDPTPTPDPVPEHVVGDQIGTPAPTGDLGPNYVLPPCIDEDQNDNCYWDADTRGNGEGDSFIVFNGFTYYIR